MYEYSIPAWLLIFYIYCFMGWVFECCVVSVQKKKLINRGFLRGPMLPIYGFGATMMLFVSLPLDGHFVKLFFAGMVVATLFEYLVGIAMEAIFKVKYWDYSEHRFQFQGRICLQSSLAWGVLSVLLVYVFQPPIDYLLRQFNALPLIFTVVVLSVYFLTDAAASVKTALDFARLLEELDALRAAAGKIRAQIAESAAETRERIADAADETRERITEAAVETRERLTDSAVETYDKLAASAENAKHQLAAALHEAEEQFNQKVQDMKRSRKGIVRGNPTLRSSKFSETLREIKERLR